MGGLPRLAAFLQNFFREPPKTICGRAAKPSMESPTPWKIGTCATRQTPSCCWPWSLPLERWQHNSWC